MLENRMWLVCRSQQENAYFGQQASGSPPVEMSGYDWLCTYHRGWFLSASCLACTFQYNSLKKHHLIVHNKRINNTKVPLTSIGYIYYSVYCAGRQKMVTYRD